MNQSNVANRFSSHEFGSVFKTHGHGGPRYNLPRDYPAWPDYRKGGADDPNMEATKIMSHWTTDMMTRFQHFMNKYQAGYKEPWSKQWFDKTAPGYSEKKEKIIKCKMELIKRLLRIKLTGPTSMEDWCLLFLYYDHRIEIPQDIETMIRPGQQRVTRDQMITNYRNLTPVPNHLIEPSLHNVYHPTSTVLPGFENDEFEGRGRPEYYTQDELTQNQLIRNYRYFPRMGTNRQLATQRFVYDGPLRDAQIRRAPINLERGRQGRIVRALDAP